MKDVWEEVGRWAVRGDRIAIAMVVGAEGSAPRPLGTKMAINDRGEIAGGVSGGCVEGAVVEIAERVIDSDRPELAHFGIADSEAWGVGLPCGGEIDVWVQAYEPGPFERAARAGDRSAEVTLLEGPRAGAKLFITPGGGHVGSLGSSPGDADAVVAARAALWTDTSARRGAIFIDVVAPPARLLLVGAVDIAEALCTLARAIGWRSFVIDPRARFARPERFPDAENVLALWPEEAFARLGGIDPATAVVALTHDPKLDDAALITALRSPAMFVGAMGSRHAQSIRLERLRDAGLESEDLERLSAPVGLDLGAGAPGETALSILAEVIAVRHGRDGGRLRTVSGPIHDIRVNQLDREREPAGLSRDVLSANA
jgi:xanthine dehydrogenase accessory factor